MADKAQHWWARSDLDYRDGSLHLGSQDLAELAGHHGTPSFVYSAARIVDKLHQLTAALNRAGVPHRIFYAMKANRFGPLINHIKQHTTCGIDVCSPRELLTAREHGFAETDITYTGTSISRADWDIIAAHQDIIFNCDSISAIRQLGQRCSGREIDLRINPQLTASALDNVSYAGEKASKFGIYPDRFDEALTTAAEYGMTVTTLHFHAGSGYLNAQLPELETILDRVSAYLAHTPNIRQVDIGGGLGVPLRAGEAPLDLDQWAGILARFASQHDVEIQVEPGDFLVKDAGALLLEVCYVEEKGGTLFVGVNGGFNLSNLHAFYGYPNIVVPLREPADDSRQTVSVAGNINEGIDLLAEDIALPTLTEGDLLAFLNLGGYSAASSSDHCMRGSFSEHLINADG